MPAPKCDTPTPGEALKKTLEEFGISISEFADYIRFSRPTVTDFCNSKADWGAQKLRKALDQMPLPFVLYFNQLNQPETERPTLAQFKEGMRLVSSNHK